MLEVLAKLSLNLAGVAGGAVIPPAIAYYALGQPHDMYHALWERFGDFRDFFMLGSSVAAATAGFVGALYLGNALFNREK